MGKMASCVSLVMRNPYHRLLSISSFLATTQFLNRGSFVGADQIVKRVYAYQLMCATHMRGAMPTRRRDNMLAKQGYPMGGNRAGHKFHSQSPCNV
jgi:hypothetical protein